MKKHSREAAIASLPSYIDYYRHSDRKALYHLALGDSIIRGVGAGEDQNLVSQFSNELGQLTEKKVEFWNEGINGMTSSELRQLVDEGKFDAEIENADIITVNIGGNDVLRAAKKTDFQSVFKTFDTLQSTFRENLEDIAAKITEKNPQATVVFLELYNPLNPEASYYSVADKLLPKWNVNIYRTAEKIPTAIVVETSHVINGDNLGNLSPDGVHPNSSGYKAIAMEIIDHFRTSPKNGSSLTLSGTYLH